MRPIFNNEDEPSISDDCACTFYYMQWAVLRINFSSCIWTTAKVYVLEIVCIHIHPLELSDDIARIWWFWCWSIEIIAVVILGKEMNLIFDFLRKFLIRFKAS